MGSVKTIRRSPRAVIVKHVVLPIDLKPNTLITSTFLRSCGHVKRRPQFLMRNVAAK